MILGVDGCREGWVGAALDDGGTLERLEVAPNLPELFARFDTCTCAGVDMPLHLLDAGQRPADLQVRTRLGPTRGRSVFPAPPSFVIEEHWIASPHKEVNTECRRRYDAGIPAQSLALRHKIREVNEAFAAGFSIIEVHPELSFLAMNGGAPLSFRKKSWGGFHERQAILAEHGLQVPTHLPSHVASLAADDILDAIAAAWTAHRRVSGRAEGFPDASPSPGKPIIWV